MQSSGKSLSVRELIVKLVIKTSNEVSKDKRFISRSKVFSQIELVGETGPFSNISCKFTVSGKISSIYKSISVNTFRLVQPELDEILRFFDSFRLGGKKTLENVGIVTNVEFVMEVSSSLLEMLIDKTMKIKCSLDNIRDLFHNARLEFTVMFT